jgi:hypothetical protein
MRGAILLANRIIFFTSLTFGLLLLGVAVFYWPPYSSFQPATLDNPFNDVEAGRLQDASRLYEELIEKKEDVLLMLSASDPCLSIDCKQFSTDLVRRFAVFAYSRKPEHDGQLPAERDLYISMGSLAVSCMSFVIAFVSFRWKERRSARRRRRKSETEAA